MTVKVSSGVFTEITNTISELENLTSLPSLNAQQQRRNSFLLAKLSALKAGISPEQIRNHERDTLLKEAGFDRDPEAPKTRLGQDLEFEYRSWLQGKPVRSAHVPSDFEKRENLAGQQALTATEGKQGGFFVPFGIAERFWEIAKQYDQIFDPIYHNAIETETGNSMSAPAVNDTSISSVQVSETSQSQEADVFNFSEVTLNAWTFRTQKVAFSIELATDSNFPVGAVLERLFALRHARGCGAALIKGNGVNGPTGLLTATVASGVSPVIASGSSATDGSANTGANSLGPLDFVNLFHKIDPAYRPFCVWVLNDSTLQALELLINKSGGPVWNWYRDGLGSVVPHIMGLPVCISPSMPNIASASNPVVLYDPNMFLVRSVPSSMKLRVYREAVGLVENGLLAAESFFRVDSNLVTNSTQPTAVYLQNHS